MRQIVLPPNSEVVVTPNDTLTTKGKKLKEGYKFRISTVFEDRKSTRLNSSHIQKSRMPSSA